MPSILIYIELFLVITLGVITINFVFEDRDVTKSIKEAEKIIQTPKPASPVPEMDTDDIDEGGPWYQQFIESKNLEQSK